MLFNTRDNHNLKLHTYEVKCLYLETGLIKRIKTYTKTYKRQANARVCCRCEGYSMCDGGPEDVRKCRKRSIIGLNVGYIRIFVWGSNFISRTHYAL